MSIYDELDRLVKDGSLFRLVPALPGTPVVRTMFASKEVNDLITGPWRDRKWEERCGSLRADLDRFITGGLITAAVDPFKGGKQANIKQLDPYPDEVWEIRSRVPRPGIRVLGRFADTDVFVALTWWHREPLRGPGSKEWRAAIVECRVKWRNLFLAYDPKSGADIHDYISGDVVSI